MPTENIYKTYDWLRRHIVLSLCLAGLLSLTLIGGTLYYEYRSVINERAAERLVSVVLKHKGAIDDFLFQIVTSMRTVTTLEPVETLRDQESLERLFTRLEAAYDYAFEDMGVIDARGEHLAYVGPFDLKTRNYRDEDWFKKAMQAEVHISNVFLGFRNLPHFIVAVGGARATKPGCSGPRSTRTSSGNSWSMSASDRRVMPIWSARTAISRPAPGAGSGSWTGSTLLSST